MSVSSSSSPFSQFWSSALRSKPLGKSSDTGEGLVRRLGPFDLILLGIGASIGAGIFVVTGTIARDAGPGVTISFLLAGASCVLNALCYAELATRFPAVVGGAYMYTYTTFNELTAFLVFTQMMLDYHIGAASIARSLASYIVNILDLIPSVKDNIPNWVGHGGDDIFGFLSFNILAPILLVLLTILLCRGVGESTLVNTVMTMTKVSIVFVVIIVGAFEVDDSNWSPFAPTGFKSILTGATVAFFAYVGFDAVANSAEESKRPQRDLPIGIIGSLLVCVVLYIGVCLVITGMVPYKLLGEDAPLAEAFKSKGLNSVSILISIGAIAGLTTTLLVGLYVQASTVHSTQVHMCYHHLNNQSSRLYLGLGRDGLLPAIFAKVHPTRHTPIHAQIWVGIVACILAGLLNVTLLSHILSVGSLAGYSVVAACVITLRLDDNIDININTQLSTNSMSKRTDCITSIIVIAFCGFTTGILYRFDPPGFSCPWVPILPAVCIFFNIFLFAQLNYEAWVRFVVLSIVAGFVYAFYGQYNAIHASDDTNYYQTLPSIEAQ
uniref:Cationic amino acid transporter C-terminal domain-containing protein n=1 Tax=Lactuca sativa TaxID=4236 RepID=A0A9R1UYD2_LACSA|nr:hypothetical protein LSAT_V11C700356630 [Lactuca sativa]